MLAERGAQPEMEKGDIPSLSVHETTQHQQSLHLLIQTPAHTHRSLAQHTVGQQCFSQDLHLTARGALI